MTTNERIEAARLTDEELLALPHNGPYISPRMVADAATAKALRVEDARHEALVAALREIDLAFDKYQALKAAAIEASGAWPGGSIYGIVKAAMKKEAPHA